MIEYRAAGASPGFFLNVVITPLILRDLLAFSSKTITMSFFILMTV